MDSFAASDFENIQIPSFPIDSPTSGDAFASLPESFQVAPGRDVWPAMINEESLLPWIDVFFKRLHPTLPILDRATLYHDMLLRKHKTDKQYGSMLLSLCAFAMTQPVQIEEHASLPSRTVQARIMMEEAVKMRVTADFGENPCIPSVLTSFFLFAYLFGNNRHKAAWHKLREAVDLACSLGMQDLTAYEQLAIRDREQWIRTYLVLSVTERAYALQQRHPIGFRGRPSMFAKMMQDFGSDSGEASVVGLISEEKADVMALTGLLYLMESFDAIDENIVGCWNGHCAMSDGQCSSFDRRLAIKAFRALRVTRESSFSGTLSIAPSIVPLSLPELGESQQADISMTQLWLTNRLWNLCWTHNLVLNRSEHLELSSDFPIYVAEAALLRAQSLDMRAMEVHGLGLAEKIFDISSGALTTLRQLPDCGLSIIDAPLDRSRLDCSLLHSSHYSGQQLTVQEIIQGLGRILHEFRNGQHPYATRFLTELSTVPSLQ
ncbi:hypothetical protein GQ53DRAFT_670383 [Thozetella sp. PMI_491]|nr:hypothetical protein GQ53DRAFT_670383 [Thozetella sp. PMI_491]